MVMIMEDRSHNSIAFQSLFMTLYRVSSFVILIEHTYNVPYFSKVDFLLRAQLTTALQ